MDALGAETQDGPVVRVKTKGAVVQDVGLEIGLHARRRGEAMQTQRHEEPATDGRSRVRVAVGLLAYLRVDLVAQVHVLNSKRQQAANDVDDLSVLGNTTTQGRGRDRQSSRARSPGGWAVATTVLLQLGRVDKGENVYSMIEGNSPSPF